MLLAAQSAFRWKQTSRRIWSPKILFFFWNILQFLTEEAENVVSHTVIIGCGSVDYMKECFQDKLQAYIHSLQKSLKWEHNIFMDTELFSIGMSESILIGPNIFHSKVPFSKVKGEIEQNPCPVILLLVFCGMEMRLFFQSRGRKIYVSSSPVVMWYLLGHKELIFQ